MPTQLSLKTLKLSALALACLALPAQALDFEAIALSSQIGLPFASGASSSYAIGLRAPTLAEDGWVGFAPGSSSAISAFMVGQPGEVRRVIGSGDSLPGGQGLGMLRSMRVGDGQSVSLTLGYSGSAAIDRHWVGQAGALGTSLLATPSTGVAPGGVTAVNTAVYNRSGSIGFELLADGQQLVHAASSNGASFEAGRLDASGGVYGVQVRTGSGSSSSPRLLALPGTAIAGVATPAANRSWASVQAVGGDASGRSFLYGLQAGSGLMVDGAQHRSNLVELRADGSAVSILHPGSSVPGVALPFQGISAGQAQFASNAQGSLVFRGDFGRNTTDQRKLGGALLRYDAGATAAEGQLSVLALPGATVPGLLSSSFTPVSFGHKLLPDSGGSLSPLSMLPDNLVLDSARGLALNEAGTVAFVSAITAAPAAAGYGVFTVDAGGSFHTLASSGSISAGAAPGTDASFAKFHDVTLNHGGLVVFSATLSGADGRQGLWYGHDAADLQLLVMEGQQIEVLPGLFKTVGNLDTGLHELMDTRITALDDGLNNAGRFAFSVVFTDGSEAVLRTALVSSVPEPQSWALLLAGGALLATALRRRRR